MADTEELFTAVEWCAGYAGIHLGLKRVIPNLRVIAFSEIEAFACANLVSKMEAGLLDAAPIWTNLKTFPCEAFSGKVDLLVAGYPCQPFSHAGKRLGEEDERHLWPHIAEGIRVMRPRWCFFENVEGHITLGLSTVLSDLAEMGYAATWGIFSAAEVGAPHQRKRVFILANDRAHEPHRLSEPEKRVDCGETWNAGAELADGGCSTSPESQQSTQLWAASTSEPSCNSRLQGGGCEREDGKISVWPSRPGELQYDWEPPRVTGAFQRQEYERMGNGNGNDVVQERGGSKHGEDFTTCGMGAESGGQVEPSLGGDSHGSTDRLDYAELCDNRVDELRLLGNGVVPATAAKAWETLYRRFQL